MRFADKKLRIQVGTKNKKTATLTKPSQPSFVVVVIAIIIILAINNSRINSRMSLLSWCFTSIYMLRLAVCLCLCMCASGSFCHGLHSFYLFLHGSSHHYRCYYVLFLLLSNNIDQNRITGLFLSRINLF